jgi:hypothetical protein
MSEASKPWSDVRASVRESPHVGETTTDVVTTLLSESRPKLVLNSGRPNTSIEKCAKGLEMKLSAHNMRDFSTESIIRALEVRSGAGLSESEFKAVAGIHDKWLSDDDTLKRTESPDFVVNGRKGFEIKSNRNYSISRRQLQAVQDYGQFYVVLSDRQNFELLDSIDWIGLNELEDISQRQ